MLIRLLPEQVSAQWEIIAPMLEASLPPISDPTPTVMVNILEAILLDHAIVWVLESESGKIKGVVLTTDWVDPICHYHHLMIYCVYGVETLSLEELQGAAQSVRKYAGTVGAESVLAYTADVRIAQLVRRLGGHADFVLLQL